ncbi:DNA replication and repair protein RecN [Thermanaeromonas toyohensis ToBE]|uniref:DNA repair protein RecN n=1 Tax=Thermanaeromonas toyohensis ToBE TaxID=698762 RepID=A0A1W1VZ71_9FIRM|nr:DNA repair protein RecN [Thermanaeromonas toyohensis]SMB98550.1 DNA replication and repair protein RecN [Thermanaeromonas toyohensis ToBE]
MLAELQIENFALIEKLKLNLGPGLNVVTGETGAGKSIIIDAIGLLVGARASGEYLREGAERGCVSGLFYCQDLKGVEGILKELGFKPEEDGSLLLTRELSRSGRHSCRINGRPVTLSMYQKIGQHLVDIHGQHAYQSLLRPTYQLQLLDSFAGLTTLRKEITEIYSRWRAVKHELEELYGDPSERERQKDLLRFQIEEIDRAAPKLGEEEELKQELKILTSAEELARGAEMVYTHLFGGGVRQASAYDLLAQAGEILISMANLDPGLKKWVTMLEEASLQVEEVAKALRSYREALEFDPKRLQEIEDRLETLRRLHRKYGRTLEDILRFREEAAATLARLEQSEELASRLEKESENLLSVYEEKAAKLHHLRLKAAKELEKEIQVVLRELAMPAAKVTIALRCREDPGPVGKDEIEFYFQPNPGEGTYPLAQIASGGEMARVMLALKSILAGVDEIPTLIFDEIDAGVGGQAARSVALRLAHIGRKRQVLCVTHSAQLASLADHHFNVNKVVQGNRTYTLVKELTGEERLLELARLLSGEASPTALKHAAELLDQAKAIKRN